LQQKRAFGSPKENPFSSFQFDPNNAESNLDALSGSRSSSVDKTSNSRAGFIPPSFGRAAAGTRTMGRRFSTVRKKSRGRTGGWTLPPTELLRNKANEMAALQGQIQYQGTVGSTGIGMSPGPYYQSDVACQQVRGGGTSIFPSFLQNAHPQSYPYQQPVPTIAQTLNQARPMTSLFPMGLPHMQQVQPPATATSPFGYNPMGPAYGKYSAMGDNMRIDGSVASHSYYTSSPRPPFSDRQPFGGQGSVRVQEDQHFGGEQHFGDDCGEYDDTVMFAGETNHFHEEGIGSAEYDDAFCPGENLGDEAIDIDPNDAIPTVIETSHPVSVPGITQVQAPEDLKVANPYAESSVGAESAEGGYMHHPYSPADNVGGAAAGNAYVAAAGSAEEGTTAPTLQNFDEAFF